MRTLFNPWFIVGCITWVIVFITRKFGHPIPYLNGYIDDAFAIPVIANLALCFQRVVIIRSNYYVLSPWKVIFIVAYVTLVFEVLLPLYSRVYTGDWIDAMLYVAGGFFFYFVMNRPVLDTKTRR
jgi:hypothetical protein